MLRLVEKRCVWAVKGSLEPGGRFSQPCGGYGSGERYLARSGWTWSMELMLSTFIVVLLAIPTSATCCFNVRNDTCLSGTNLSLCQNQSCEQLCSGLTFNGPTNYSCVGAYYEYANPQWEIFVPEFAIRPNTIGRRLLFELLDLLVFCPIGYAVNLMIPKGPPTGAALQAVKETNDILGNGLNASAELSALLQKETQLRQDWDNKTQHALLALNEDLQTIKTSFNDGFTTVYKNIAYLLSAVDAARQEAAFLDRINNNANLFSRIQLSQAAQKLGRIASLGEFDSRLKIDADCQTFSYYATTWLYDWVLTNSGYELFSLFSRVTVEKCPTVACYLNAGQDCFYWDYSVEPIYIGQTMDPALASCTTNIGDCTATFLASCRLNPSCYAYNDPSVATPGFGLGYGTFQGYSSVFRSNPNADDDGCGGYTNVSCCVSNQAHSCLSCENSIGIRKCDPRLDILGFRLTTLWLPSNPQDPFIRSMEEMGGTSQPLFPFLIGGFRRLNITINSTVPLKPYATEFHNPLKVGESFMTPKIYNLTDFQGNLQSSGGGGPNINLCNYGSFRKMRVGKAPGQTYPMILEPEYVQDSYQILSWNAGDQGRVGWLPREGCTADAGGICCNEALTTIQLEATTSLASRLRGFQPKDYAPLVYVVGIEERLNLSLRFNSSQLEADWQNQLTETALLQAKIEVTQQKFVNLTKQSNDLGTRIDNALLVQETGSILSIVVIVLIVGIALIVICAILYFCCFKPGGNLNLGRI